MKKNIVLFLWIIFLLFSCNIWNKQEIKTNSWKTEININEKTTNSWNIEKKSICDLPINKKENMKNQLENKNIVAIITTNKGKIELSLDTKDAPITTSNFVGLAKKWYYNWVIFHRIIKDFMIQWWDPEGTWMWWESIYWEKFIDEFSENLKNDKFTISMANSWPNTNGSQFFINVANNNFLDGKHSVFGKVISGEDNVLNISKVKTNNLQENRPEKEVKIISIDIKEKKDDKLIDFDFSEEKAKKYYQNYECNLDKKIAEQKKKEQEAKKDMKIKVWNIVSLNFTLKDEKGKVLSSSVESKMPLTLKIEKETQILSGLVEDLIWKKIWYKNSLSLTPKKAFWKYDDKLRQEVNKSELKSFEDAWIKLEVWTELPTQNGVFKILEVKDNKVVIDLNHMFAGKTITIDFDIADIN